MYWLIYVKAGGRAEGPRVHDIESMRAHLLLFVIIVKGSGLGIFHNYALCMLSLTHSLTNSLTHSLIIRYVSSGLGIFHDCVLLLLSATL